MGRIELPIEGMTCEHCVRTVTGALQSVPGVRSASVSLAERKASVETDDGRATPDELAAAVARAGYRVPALAQIGSSIATAQSPAIAAAPEAPLAPAAGSDGENLLLNVEGMTCASCVARVETALQSVPGVRAARANLATNQAAVELDPRRVNVAALVEAVRRAGYDAAPVDASESAGSDLAARRAHDLATWRTRLIVAAALSIPIVAMHFWSSGGALATGLQLGAATVLQFYVGWPFYVGAWRRARHLSTNMDTLVTIGTLAAWAAGVDAAVASLDAASHQHAPRMDLMDAAIILTFMTLGKFLEARAKGQASAAIQKLLDLAPPTANVERDGRVVTVAPSQVVVGETIVVRPGEKVPLDAEVLSGTSTVDESWLTGESVPVDKTAGSEILAGTINSQGALTGRVLRLAGQTALAQVVELVRRAQESKTEIQRLADRVVSWFVPVVLAIAAVTILAWGVAGDWSEGIESMVAVLVVACPCALGLATPTAILVASGRGAELGILIKEAHALEIAGRVDLVVFDKTGTITLGKPELIDVVAAEGVSADDLLATAAAVEELSQHPLAEPIRQAAHARRLTLPAVRDLEIVPGQGVVAHNANGLLLVGNARLMTSHGIDWTSQREKIETLAAGGQSPLLVARGSRFLGLVVVADKVAPHSREAVERLKGQGTGVMLLSGDQRAIAERIAREVGIERVEAEVLPDEKQQVIAPLRSGGKVVAMVGDGINDAPALAAADLGIAVGSGSDIAIEAADIVITGGDLCGVPRALALSRATLSTIRQNLAWAFLYNVILIPVAAGALVPWFAVRLPAIAAAAAMALSSVSVVTNSLLLRARRID